MYSWKFYGSILLFILGIIAIKTYLFTSTKKIISHKLLVKADQFYKQKDYLSALTFYKKFAQKYPNDRTIYFIRQRIQHLTEILLKNRNIGYKKEQEKTLIQELLRKAIISYHEGRYLKPENDNSMMYVLRIIKLDPDNLIALKIQRLIISNYKRKAVKAVEEQHYIQAAANYKNILQITPEDITIQKKLYTINSFIKKRTIPQKSLSSNYQHRPLSRSSPKRHTSTVSQNKNQPSFNIAQAPLMMQIPYSSKKDFQTLPKTTTYTTQKHIALPPPSTVPLVKEKFIDGEKKQYIKKVVPEIPGTWSHNKTSIVRTECIVGIDGRVESVRMILSNASPQLTQLFIATLKQYQYKPATQKGKPVRFKVIESISYVK